MDQQSIAPHETMQLHELLTFKNVSLTKSIAMSILVTDEELKSILQNDVSTSRQHIKQLSELMKYSSIAAPEGTES